MHRRAVLELSRRQGVDLNCAARHRTAFSPVPAYVPRRTFRSSLATFNSSQSPSNSNGDDGGTPRPKFGAGWGAQKTTTSAGLSPAEQAMRDAIVAKHTQERKAQDDKAHEQKRREEQRKAASRKDDRSSRQHPFAARKQPHATTNDSGRHRETGRNRGHIVRVPEHLRQIDWDCPGCSYHCFGKHVACPSCGTSRPELHSTRPNQERKPNQTLRIRKVGQDPMSEWGLKKDSWSSEIQQNPEQVSKDSRAKNRWASGPKYALTSKEQDETGEATLGATASDELKDVKGSKEQKKAKKAKEPKEPKKAETTKQEWSWDMSALERIQDNAVEDSHKWKESKRREGRKQRESDIEEDEDFESERRSRREERKRMKKEKSRQKEVVEDAPSPLYLPEFISVSNLADVIGVRPAQFVQRMEDMGFEDVAYDHVLDAETAGLVATEFNFEPIFETPANDDLTAAPEPEDKSSLPARPPVVTIMGHVDHGKTTLLDWLRKSSVVASEHGGITQHIGAFSVAMPSGKTITFLDTPGHAAFLDMRRRGADVTDIVVLVVAADDSVKPQTLEAIKHATQAQVPIIVAISKIDREGGNPDKVKQDLAVHGIHVEDYGGDVQAIGVSGKTGQGMLDLEESILALSEMLDHRADPTGNVEGWVVEGTTKSHGRVATVLIRRGTLRVGDVIVAGTTWARVRTLRNEAGVAVEEATPGMPVEIDGWREQPEAGTELLQASTEQIAKDVVEFRQERTETQKLGEDTAAINEARRQTLERRRQEESESDPSSRPEQASGPKPVHFIVKADVGGSAEAVLNSVAAIGNNEVYANVLRSGVGPIGEFDIEHAASANGHLISFNMPIEPAMIRMAETKGVRIMDYNIIYKLIDEVKAALSEHLPPNVTQRVTGEAEIGQIFQITLKGREKTSIAGCKVRNGMINKTRKVRVLRGQDVVFDGSITSLKNVKKDVTEMRKDTECGISFDNWTSFEVGDHVQCYEEIYEKRYL